MLIVALGLFIGLNGLDGWIWGPADKSAQPAAQRPRDYVLVGGSRLHYDAIGIVALIALVGLLLLLLNRTRSG